MIATVDDRTAIILGACSGLGSEGARDLGGREAGSHVVPGVCDPARGRTAAVTLHISARTAIALVVASLRSVARFVVACNAECRRLGVVNRVQASRPRARAAQPMIAHAVVEIADGDASISRGRAMAAANSNPKEPCLDTCCSPMARPRALRDRSTSRL
jgi:hypothetical protein